jgi:hypothetical protein
MKKEDRLQGIHQGKITIGKNYGWGTRNKQYDNPKPSKDPPHPLTV